MPGYDIKFHVRKNTLLEIHGLLRRYCVTVDHGFYPSNKIYENLDNTFDERLLAQRLSDGTICVTKMANGRPTKDELSQMVEQALKDTGIGFNISES
jgi:hypothetical protein